MPTSNTLSHRAFNLVCFHDVELGEAFLQRIPNTSDVPTLNHHIRLLLASLPGDTTIAREHLDDRLEPEWWLCMFNNTIVPVLIESRLPADTRRVHTPYYACE